MYKGINRGIFGVPSSKKCEIESLVELLESQNPTPDPTLNLDKVSSIFPSDFGKWSLLGNFSFICFYNWQVGGCWKLVYSTVAILGSKRTKLGLRDFITLGDFFQNINVVKV